MLNFCRIVLLGYFVAAVASASGADSSERRFIREGMDEGDVLLKIGKPDNASEDTGGGARIVEKRWVYLPARGDDRTITTLILRNGKVVEVNRKVTQ